MAAGRHLVLARVVAPPPPAKAYIHDDNPSATIGLFFSTVLGSVFLLALVGALVGPAVYWGLSGQDASAVVTRKRELIRPNDGFWTRQLFVDVTVQALAEPDARAAQIAVDARTFDSVAVGQPVAVRYVQNDTMRRLNNIVFARLATQPAFSSFTAALAGDEGGEIVLGARCGWCCWPSGRSGARGGWPWRSLGL